jgi:hypothetical protein
MTLSSDLLQTSAVALRGAERGRASVNIQQQRRLEGRVSSVYLQCDTRVLLRQCAFEGYGLTVMATVCGIIERVSGLPIVPSRCGGRLAHLLLVVTLELIHGGGVAQMLREDREARLLK